MNTKVISKSDNQVIAKADKEAKEFWQKNNRALLNDEKVKLERKVKELNRLIETNEEVETFQEAFKVYSDLQKLK